MCFLLKKVIYLEVLLFSIALLFFSIDLSLCDASIRLLHKKDFFVISLCHFIGSTGIYEQRAISKTEVSLSGSKGNFSSSNYPSTYPSMQEQDWRIAVDSGQYVKLTINSLNLEGYGFYQCPFDTLEIRDGACFSSDLLGIFCGNLSTGFSWSLFSSSRHMWVRFNSDETVGRAGFTASYSSVGKNDSKYARIFVTATSSCCVTAANEVGGSWVWLQLLPLRFAPVIYGP